MTDITCHICGSYSNGERLDYEDNNETVRMNLDDIPDDWVCHECKTDKISIELWGKRVD